MKVKNGERRLTFMVISQGQGRYTAGNLPLGKYEVQGVGGDFQSAMSAPLDVTAGRPATVDLALTVQRAPDLPHAWPGMLPGQMPEATADPNGFRFFVDGKQFAWAWMERVEPKRARVPSRIEYDAMGMQVRVQRTGRIVVKQRSNHIGGGSIA